tara:strand:- start:23 stop:463 length:441 start_codon:yes stop_codon:yes gene_type:complete
MKAWIRDSHYMDEIPALRLKDNALLHIFPLKDDPAEQIPSQRDDGIETILWHGEKYEVFSIDLEWENSASRVSPTSFKPARPPHGFVEALNDYCQDYYKHYEGYPVEFEYKDQVYNYEYFFEYLSPLRRIPTTIPRDAKLYGEDAP